MSVLMFAVTDVLIGFLATWAQAQFSVLRACCIELYSAFRTYAES
jgi:hypothetical protein